MGSIANHAPRIAQFVAGKKHHRYKLKMQIKHDGHNINGRRLHIFLQSLPAHAAYEKHLIQLRARGADALPQAVNNVVHRRPMPHSGDKKRQEVANKRQFWRQLRRPLDDRLVHLQEEIIAYPKSQRDMPTRPEVDHVARHKWPIKILRQSKPK